MAMALIVVFLPILRLETLVILKRKDSIYHKRALPHLHPTKGIFFITWRLFGSIPMKVLKKMQDEFRASTSGIESHRKFFKNFDDWLDGRNNGPYHLSNQKVAALHYQHLVYRDKRVYDMIAFCIMSNHIHAVFRLKEDTEIVSKIMQTIKRRTAYESNKILGLSGSFWLDESYDRLVRNKLELERTVKYILRNPVKAGLCKNDSDWKWSYFNQDLLIDILANEW